MPGTARACWAGQGSSLRPRRVLCVLCCADAGRTRGPARRFRCPVDSPPPLPLPPTRAIRPPPAAAAAAYARSIEQQLPALEVELRKLAQPQQQQQAAGQ